MFSRLPLIIGRIACSTHRLTTNYMNKTILLTNRRVDLREPSIGSPFLIQSRGFKDKEVLKIRCKDCYFKYVDNRWWVLCDSHPRHKQRQKVDDIKRQWIVTHITRTGTPFKKHFQYPGHHL